MVGIYRIFNIINNKSYVGQSIDIQKRWERHIYNSDREVKSELYNDIRKYGIENFKLEVLEQCLPDRVNLKLKERYWIEKLNTIHPNGYNRSNGAEGISGWKICSEGRKSISEYRKRNNIWSGKNNPWYGKGRDMTGENNSFYGKHHSEESKEKNRQAHLGKKKSLESKIKQGNTIRGRRVINNGVISKKIDPTELDYYLSNGWSTGYLKRGDI